MPHLTLANDLILLFALTFALYRVGDIWTFQVVLFPLWPIVRSEDFPAYQQKHLHSIFDVIFVPMGSFGSGRVAPLVLPSGWGAALATGHRSCASSCPVPLLALLGSPAVENRERGQPPETHARIDNGSLEPGGELDPYAAVVLWLMWIRLRICGPQAGLL
jgi:hypothetical protein